MKLQLVHIVALLANLLLAIAIFVFAVGFFPHKAVLPGLAKWPDPVAETGMEAPFDRLIFMVVDALRSDFVYSNASNFHFTQSLIRSGAAVPFTGHASPPTITMPKVKAITTGSVPSFIDLILNFAESDTTSTLAAQDSWLAQMKAKPNGKLVMFGDDTWLRLFPGVFDRSDGTTSFFVSDFTEVDHNVTRNIPAELENEDWSGMIFHYLGLDHIGHKTGPQGPNMPAKQREMDGVVETVYNAMESQAHLENTLLVLLGDHGMNEAGNHGASSAGETSTALTFISPKFKTAFGGDRSPLPPAHNFEYYDVVEQSDIAVTLAALLGFPTPKNSLGIIIPRLLEMWSSEKERLDMLYLNAEQMQKIAGATFADEFAQSSPETCQSFALTDEQSLACDWQVVARTRSEASKSAANIKASKRDVEKFLSRAQSLLSTAASKYDLPKMGIGIGLTFIAWVVTILVGGEQIISSGFAGLYFAFLTLFYAITMFASSYVEEEHQFWYWITSAWLVLLTVKSQRYSSTSTTAALTGNVAILISFGIARRWNQTGQKYAGEADLVTEVVSTYPWVLWLSVVVTYAIISRRLSRKAANWGPKQMALIPAFVTVSAFLFKLAFTAADAPELLKGITLFDSTVAFVSKYSLIAMARLVFLGLAHLTVTAFVYDTPWEGPQNKQTFLESLHDIISLLLVTQSRTLNVPLFTIYYLQATLLQSCQSLTSMELTVTSLTLQYSSFFAFGGTNAISSVDLSNAYNGVAGYNVLAVGVLTFVSNWAGPIWWTSATSCLLSQRRGAPGTRVSVHHFFALTQFAAASTLAVMLACLVLREHLFMWTVFSPRYLYTLAWVYAQHIVINGIFGSLILGTR